MARQTNKCILGSKQLSCCRFLSDGQAGEAEGWRNDDANGARFPQAFLIMRCDLEQQLH